MEDLELASHFVKWRSIWPGMEETLCFLKIKRFDLVVEDFIFLLHSTLSRTEMRSWRMLSLFASMRRLLFQCLCWRNFLDHTLCSCHQQWMG